MAADDWPYLALAYAILLGMAGLLVWAWRHPEFLRRRVGAASASDLAAIRIVIGGIILLNLLWEDLAGTSSLPREMQNSMGATDYLYAIPGFAGLLVHEKGLFLAHVLLGMVTLSAIVGFRTRLSCFLAGIGLLVMGGIIRHYSSYFHTMLVPGWVMTALAVTPCGDALSVDSWLRRRRGAASARTAKSGDVYAWSRLLIWTIIATFYVQAGLSKLVNGGLAWMSPESFRHVILTDALRPYYFYHRFEVGIWVARLPDWVLGPMAVMVVVAELCFFLVLVWPLARRVLPMVLAGMHVGIWLVQNVAFVDMILIQLVFYDLTGHGRRLARRLSPRQTGNAPLSPPPVDAGPLPRLLGVLILSVVLVQGVMWIHRIEYYPLTANQMYSRSFSIQPVFYEQVIVVYADGRREMDSPGHVLPTYWEGRARPIVRQALMGDVKGADAFFRHWARVHNARAPAEARIVAFEINRRCWDYSSDPDDPERGRIQEYYRYSVERDEGVQGRFEE